MTARYRCTRVEPGMTDGPEPTKYQETVALDPVYGDGNPVTYGSITLGIEDAAQFGHFEVGKEYVVDLMPVE